MTNNSNDEDEERGHKRKRAVVGLDCNFKRFFFVFLEWLHRSIIIGEQSAEKQTRASLGLSTETGAKSRQ